MASLLEVGTGFHPELTGRENVYLNGSILGMSRKEIQNKFDEIIDFSGTEKFLDTPLKFYSSGMQLRLAFSVAAFLEPEIMVIDEVLAVGDAEFQKKCIGKMGQVSRAGRTVILVSHNLTVVTTLCGRAVLMEAMRSYSFAILFGPQASGGEEGAAQVFYTSGTETTSPTPIVGAVGLLQIARPEVGQDRVAAGPP